MPRFIHPHDVPMQGQYMPSYGQPHPHEVHLGQIQQSHEMAAMQGHTHFVAQVSTYDVVPCAEFILVVGEGGTYT